MKVFSIRDWLQHLYSPDQPDGVVLNGTQEGWMFLKSEEARKLADDIYEKLGVPVQTMTCSETWAAYVKVSKENEQFRAGIEAASSMHSRDFDEKIQLARKGDDLQEKLYKKDVEIMSLIAEKKLAQKSAWDLDAKLKEALARNKELHEAALLNADDRDKSYVEVCELRKKNADLRKALDKIVVDASRATW